MNTRQFPRGFVGPQLWAVGTLAFLSMSCSAEPKTFNADDPHSPLHLVRSIELPDVKGRIDHMAVDAERKHLFVAEYANGSVDEVDLASGKVVARTTGIHEPQGVGWLSKQEEIAVASGDGLVTFYRATDLQKVASIRLGDDADDVRIDERNGNLVVGFGSGALAVIDPSTHDVIRRITLPAHPEAFALLGSEVVVNVPGTHEVIIADLDEGRITATRSTLPLLSNYALASDGATKRVAVSYRLPSMLSVLDARSLDSVFTARTCGDADDVYYHVSRILVVCGSGSVELIDAADGRNAVEVVTGPGARTALLVPQPDRLFIARPSRGRPAAILEFAFT